MKIVRTIFGILSAGATFTLLYFQVIPAWLAGLVLVISGFFISQEVMTSALKSIKEILPTFTQKFK